MTMIILHPYQFEVFRAVLDSVAGCKGLTFTVEMARQGGKNEVSAHLETALLSMFAGRGGSAVKCSPTFLPQARISRQRLEDRLADYGFGNVFVKEAAHIIRLGNAHQVFLSAAPEAAVVGHTADILLEIDEAQDVSKQKFSKDFRPMVASTNATVVLYGTTWDDGTLLEETKRLNLELEHADGIKRHFSYDWQVIAACNPAYRAAAEAERKRLGEGNPWWLTQYALKTLPRLGRLLSRDQLSRLLGSHPRLHSPTGGRYYVAGIDLAGEAAGPAFASLSFRAGPRSGWPEESGGAVLPATSAHDSTVIIIAEVAFPGPIVRVVEHYAFTGTPLTDLYRRLLQIVRDTWHCRRIVVDATGLGAGIASFLCEQLGSRVVPFTFTARDKSALGYELLTAIDCDRLSLHASDGSADYLEMVRQLEFCRPEFRASHLLNFYVDPAEGHDDYVMALALAVHAAARAAPRIATMGSLL